MSSPWFLALALGILQGATEFLPISSSGHLALAQSFFPGIGEPLLLDIMLHVGTLVAVMIYFRHELLGLLKSVPGFFRKPGADDEEADNRMLIVGLIIAQFPTAAIGLMLEDRVEFLLASPVGVGMGLLATALVLVLGEWLGQRTGAATGPPTLLQAALIGVVQGLAVIPGLSRSGSTIACARALGIGGATAARFSFLISVPAVAGAALLELLGKRAEIGAFSAETAWTYLVVGPVVAGLVGYVAIGAMMGLVKAGRLSWFAPYLLVVGGAAVASGIWF